MKTAGVLQGVRSDKKVHAAVRQRIAEICEGKMSGGFVSSLTTATMPGDEKACRRVEDHGGPVMEDEHAGRQFNCSSRAGEFQKRISWEKR